MILSIIQTLKSRVRFNKNELAGSVGDLGVILPLVIGMIAASNFNSSVVFIVYGSMLIFSGFVYGFPMAVQPLKAVAAIVIALQLDAEIVWGGAFAIGITMFLLTITGFLSFLTKFIPKSVIRGIQFGLGLALTNIALKTYVGSSSTFLEWSLVVFSGIIVVFFLGNKKVPASLLLIVLGFGFSLVFKDELTFLVTEKASSTQPFFNIPSVEHIIQGFLLLALPQIPLSIGNSVLASKQLIDDLYPEKKINIKKIGFTYSFMNLVSSFFGGVPTCHGSNGIAGQHVFGARTGGSVVFQGIFFLLIGTVFHKNLQEILHLFPYQVLGILLFVEALALIKLIRDQADSQFDFGIALIVGLISFTLPYGFLIGMVVGTILYYNKNWFKKKSKTQLR